MIVSFTSCSDGIKCHLRWAFRHAKFSLTRLAQIGHDQAHIGCVTQSAVNTGFPSASWGTSGDGAISEGRWQFKEKYVRSLSRHEIQAGVDISYMPYVEGNSGSSGTYTFTEDQYVDPRDPPHSQRSPARPFSRRSSPGVHPASHYLQCWFRSGRVEDSLQIDAESGAALRGLYGAANEDINPATFPVAIPYIQPE